MNQPTLRSLCAKATPGPWIAGDALDSHFAFPIAADSGKEIAGVNALEHVLSGYGEAQDRRSRSPEGQAEAAANAQLIARCSPETMAAVVDALESCVEWPDQETGEQRLSFNEKKVERALSLLNATANLNPKEDEKPN